MARTGEDASTDQQVAIVGMACRLPGAASVDQFWTNLLGGVESLSTFTDEELIASGVSPEVVQSPHYVKSRGIIGGADRFDASFFGFTPRDAELLDPQHRIFLECAWHALEDGGYLPGQTDARIACYGGVGTNWHMSDVSRHPDAKKFASAASVVTSNDKDYLTTRVSYKLDLTGPSVNVQCACSTSLVATIMGMNSLRSYHCDLALAGGATIEIPEKKGYLYQEGGMESADGRCRPFDAQANGTVFSRGAGVVLLKRLSDAIRDRDHIYAVILDGAINNDGSLKSGFTAPSVNGQVEVAIEALERAGVSADTLSFVEAHGTATSLGDPIEVASLTQAFRHYTTRRQFCAIGSVKGNIGHTDVASGLAGLIKTALALEQRTLPASLNFETPNPKIDFPTSPFFVNTAPRPLPRGEAPLRALINAFGVGGTNACLILEEPPAQAVSPTATSASNGNAEIHASGRPENVLLLSAKTDTALDAAATAMREFVEAHPGVDPNDLAYTSQVGRRHFSHRRAVPFAANGISAREDLLARLGRPAGAPVAIRTSDEPSIVFAFPGQGNQYVGMGRGLYEREPVFRDAVDGCCDLLRPMLDADLRDVMWATGADAAQRLNQTYVTQPALFVISYAQARLWMSWGLKPDAMIGHSVGEYVAACLAGIFPMEEALTAVARRGQLIQALPRGSMLAVLLPEEETLPYLSPSLSVAAVNGPQLTVVAGPTPDIADLEARLASAPRGKRIVSKRLDTSHAFHSAMMDPALPEFARVIAGVALAPPSVPIVSTVTGNWLTADDATRPDYWVQHMRRPVRLLDAFRTLIAHGQPYIFLESGPGRSLASAAKHLLDAKSPHRVVTSMRADSDPGTDIDALMAAVGALWASGRAVSWPALYGNGHAQPRRVSMPGYPFERQRFALDFSADAAATAQRGKKKDTKNPDVAEWFYLPCWKRTPTPDFAQAHAALRTDAGRRCWILFEDRAGLATAIQRRLDALGDDVIVVQAGEEYRQIDDRRFTVRVGVKRDYEDLVGGLKDAGRKPTRVVHLWNVDAEERAPALDGLREAEGRAFYGPIFLQQAFIKHNLLDDLRMLVVTTGAMDVAGEGVRNPTKALATGPCRVLGKEFPMTRARLVDVAFEAGDTRAMQALAEQLIDEAQLETLDTVAAYRRGYRWTESFEQVRLEGPQDLRPWIRDEGVYLITGGLGGLGLFFARQIAQTTRNAALVLTQRSPLPERSEWPRWLAERGEQDSTSERIKGVQSLEEAGARVMVAAADCADFDAMQEVVREAERRFGRISGVIHAAGMAGGGIISLKSDDMAAEVLEPKVRGSLVLDRVLQQSELELTSPGTVPAPGAPFRDTGVAGVSRFVLLFSSITSVLGEAGRVDYCAANAFMDALAQYHRGRSATRVWAIDWGSWGEFGMAARWQESKAQRKGARGKAKRTEDGPRVLLVPVQSAESAGQAAAAAPARGAQQIYDVLLDAEQDWVINSHRVFGVPSLVGTTFLEIAQQWAQAQHPGRVPVLERLSFISPLMFEPGKEKKVRLFVDAIGDEAYKFSFRSQLVERGDSKSVWHRHFVGELRLAARTDETPAAAPPRVDLAALRARFTGEPDMGPFFVPQDAEVPFLHVGERWSIRNGMWSGDREWLARVELQDRHLADLPEHPYHPAISDVCFAAAALAAQTVEPVAYLPSSYARVAFAAPYAPKVWSHIRLHGTFEPGADTLSFDVTVLDDEGRQLAAVEQYNLKKVTATASAPRTTQDKAAGAAPGAVRAHEDPKNILPDEGLSALARILHAPFMPQVVVCTSDLHRMIEDEQPASKSAAKDEPAETAAKKEAAYARPALSTPYEAPDNEVEKAIADIWQGILGIDQIGVNDDFSELGGNSLLAVQTVANIADAFGVDLPVDAFTRRPTVRGQAETVLELLVAMASEETLEDLVSNLEQPSS